MNKYDKLVSLVNGLGYQVENLDTESLITVIEDLTKRLGDGKEEEHKPVACAVYRKGDDITRVEPYKLYKSVNKARGYIQSRFGGSKEDNKKAVDKHYKFVPLYR